ncbi:MAG TPA: NADH-quinone oxidoreductase subunit C [Thermoanaerobaculia bacterium]|nr:NADH-quinone oxidoreductase subunit C [Thermoanaerobaculia bacterium]
MPAAPPARSVDEIKRDPLVSAAVSRIDDAILGAKDFVGELTLFIDRDRIVDVCRAFKDDGFVYLVDLAGVDYSKYPGHTGLRFSVAYTLYSFQKNARVRLRVWTDENGAIPSVTSVWKTANWHERETFDMLGITFSGHPNLERILMWDGFNGFPLRKDFPIRGIDTGARIYPEVFPEGGGPKVGSTGKDAKDVNLYKGEWKRYGTWPVAQIGGGNGAKAAPAKPAVAAAPKAVAAPAAAPAAAASPAPNVEDPETQTPPVEEPGADAPVVEDPAPEGPAVEEPGDEEEAN